MKFLHAMIRVLDLDKSLKFFINDLGLKEVRRKEVPKANLPWSSLQQKRADLKLSLPTTGTKKTPIA